MSLKLYFLRHGETISSQTGTYCGRLDIDLTASGYQMAEQFADAYQDLPWTAIFASPLHRTMATATPLSQRIGMPIQRREGLKEIAYGAWEGKTPEEVNREFHDDYVRWLADPGWNAPSGGEGNRYCPSQFGSAGRDRTNFPYRQYFGRLPQIHYSDYALYFAGY